MFPTYFIPTRHNSWMLTENYGCDPFNGVAVRIVRIMGRETGNSGQTPPLYKHAISSQPRLATVVTVMLVAENCTTIARRR